MKGKILACLIACLTFLGVSPAFAIPTLQLDILPGHYDTATQTTIADSTSFMLRAILSPEGDLNSDSIRKATLLDTFYISAALMPKTNVAGDHGSFTIDGNTIDVTGDMYYGIPPFESFLPKDPGDLGKHSIFSTYFKEFTFNFPHSTQALYNTQDSTKTPVAGVAYYNDFLIDVTNMNPGFYIHFDLYSTSTANGDTDIVDFAPFSHDAQSGIPRTPVPEPGTMILLGSGLVGLAGWGRKKFRK